MNLHIINILKKQFNNNEFFKKPLSILILLTYSYFWISIGKNVEIDFSKFLNIGLTYLIIFSTCLFILIFKLIKNEKLPIFSIILIYPVASSIGYFNNIDLHQNFDYLIHFFFTISTLLLFFFILENRKNTKKLFNYFFKISLIFIFLVFIIIVFPDFVNKIIYKIHVREINFVTLNLFFFDYKYIQNSNGAARIVVLLFIFFFTKFIFKIKKNKKYKKYLILNILFSILIFYYQSRLSIIFMTIYVLLWILTFSNKSFFLKIIFFISIIIVPFVIQNVYSTKMENKYADIKKLDILKNNRIFGVNFSLTAEDYNYGDSSKICRVATNNKTFEILDIYSSGRFCGWEILLRDIDKKDILFGKGFFYDQKFLKKYQKISSNSYINIIYNSGLIGFFPFLLIFIIVISKYQIIYNFYKKSNYDDFLMFNLMLFLMIRSFFEDIFAFVSIDFILFLTCSIILFSKIKEFNNDKKIK